MAILKISSYIISHDFSIMFLIYNKDNRSNEKVKEINKNHSNNISQHMENDLFFDFMKFEDSIYETGKISVLRTSGY